MHVTNARLMLAALACGIGLPHAADATVVSGIITGTINNWGNGIDTGGYFSASAGTSLLGQTMTIHYTCTTTGTGVAYTHDGTSPLITYTNADPESYTMSWTVGSVTFARDLSNGGPIDADHNGSPSRYDCG